MRAAAPAIVIAGAGGCGTRAAFTLREQGWDGQLILIGAEPSPPYERARRAAPYPAILADPATPLKALLREPAGIP